jgi:hypothetical protein
MEETAAFFKEKSSVLRLILSLFCVKQWLATTVVIEYQMVSYLSSFISVFDALVCRN